ncbi:uncharacterized protein LOC141611115 [Silene latifolia]|uniref:uncharacterized protein LOC141611115 n=1 Tax=Silene latifolia TaxID=37657 RepID=UPI003D76B7D7
MSDTGVPREFRSLLLTLVLQVRSARKAEIDVSDHASAVPVIITLTKGFGLQKWKHSSYGRPSCDWCTVSMQIYRTGTDLSSLCIVEGKTCWDLYIDRLVVSSDGNLLDAFMAQVSRLL